METISSTAVPLSSAMGLLTVTIFALTLFAILKKPWNIHESYATACGALLMLLFGCLTPAQALATIANGANVLIFLFALMLFSILLEKAGFFEWSALHAARAANGSGIKLYTNVFVVGALTTALLSLDTTAIILTPIVISFVHRLKLNELPFVMACAFIANTGSLLLPVSNLTNLLFAHAFNEPFQTFFGHMLLPQLAAIVVNYVLFVLIFRSKIFVEYNSDLPEPSSVINNQLFFKLALSVLGLVVIGYFLSSVLNIPTFAIALTGCLLLLIPALKLKTAKLSDLRREISWELFPFVIGLFIEIRGLENLGLVQIMAKTLNQFSHHPFEQLLSTALAAALGSNIVNNVPMALLSISVLQQSPHLNSGSQYAALIGCNIGPNLTIAGSLATMLVLTAARKRDVDVTAWQFFKTGIVVTPLVLLFSTISLWLTIQLTGGALQ